MSLIRPNEQLVTELFAVYVKQQQTWTSHASRARLLAFGDLPSRFTWVSCKLSVGKSLHVFIGQRWISFRNKAQLSSQSLTRCLPSQFSRLILPRYTPNLLVKSLSEKYYLARKESEFEPLSFFLFGNSRNFNGHEQNFQFPFLSKFLSNNSNSLDSSRRISLKNISFPFRNIIKRTIFRFQHFGLASS